MQIASRLQNLGWTLYAPFGRLKHLLKKPPLVAPDIRSLDICWNQIVRDETYRNDHFNIREHNAVIFDVGANVGVFTAWAAMHYRPARIFSYEPDPNTFQYLSRNAKSIAAAAPATALAPINLAVSSVAGAELILYHSPSLCAGNTMMPIGKEFGWEPVKVKTTTVSQQMRDLGITKLDLLKIDVEGHAAEVLRGIRDEDYPRIENIVLECDYVPEGGTPAGELRAMLDSHGYTTEYDDPTLTNNLTLYAWR